MDRPLITVRHWRRNVGRLVRFVPGGTRSRTGVGVADDGVTLGRGRVVQRFDIAELGQGRVQVEFSRPPGGRTVVALTSSMSIDRRRLVLR